MGANPGNTPVIKEWAWSLSWKQQTVLMSALRGCDTAGKNDPSKAFIRRLRNAVLHNGGPDDADPEFMTPNVTKQDVYDFTKSMDQYPIHFILHLVHAAEVVGYNHPDSQEREFWYLFYNMFVDAFHMLPEDRTGNDHRLRDGVETCCHKT